MATAVDRHDPSARECVLGAPVDQDLFSAGQRQPDGVSLGDVDEPGRKEGRLGSAGGGSGTYGARSETPVTIGQARCDISAVD